MSDGKKKGVTMSLHSFLGTDSWADSTEDTFADGDWGRGDREWGYDAPDRYGDRRDDDRGRWGRDDRRDNDRYGGADRYGGDRYSRGDRYGGGDRYGRSDRQGDDRYGGGDRFGGDRFRGGPGGDRRGGSRERNGDRYGDRPSAGFGDRRDAPREIPTEPPFTAYLGNLPYDITEPELEDFFAPECKVVSVRLMKDRETQRLKGFGYIEFEDQASLREALARADSIIMGRNIRIDLAEGRSSSSGVSRADAADTWERGQGLPGAPPEERERRTDRDWRSEKRDDREWRGDRRDDNRRDDRDWRSDRRDDSYSRRQGGRYGDRDGYSRRDDGRRYGGNRYGDRDRPRRDDGYDRHRRDRYGDRRREDARDDYPRRTSESGERSSSAERPKIKINPRTVDEPVAAPAKLSKSSPFGEAKPRDENEILRKKEEERRRREEARLQREKEEIEKQRLEEEPPLPLDAEKQKPVEAETSNKFAALNIDEPTP